MTFSAHYPRTLGAATRARRRAAPARPGSRPRPGLPRCRMRCAAGEAGCPAGVTRRKGWGGRRARVPATQQGFLVGWRFRRRPRVPLPTGRGRGVVLVDDSQRLRYWARSARCRFTEARTVSAQPNCSASNRRPVPATSTHRPARDYEVPRGQGFQRLIHRPSGQPGGAGEIEAAVRPTSAVFQGFVGERRGVAQFPEHRPQRVQLPGLPADSAGPGGDLVGDPDPAPTRRPGSPSTPARPSRRAAG